MAAVLKKQRGIDAELIQGSGGIFDVRANGKLIFSKKAVGRFPEDSEILEVISV